MKKNPLVYIILPVYNWEKYFLEQLMSIYHQTFTNRFLIIVNDGSKDSSEDIAKQFIEDYSLYDKVKILKKENWGLNSAIQRWLEEIKKMCDVNKSNSLISYCDCDDIWTKNKLSVQVEYMTQHPECGLLYHNLYLINEHWELLQSSFCWNYHNGDFLYITTMWICCVAWTIVFRSKYIDNILPLPTQQWMAQDAWTIFVLSLLKIEIHYLNKNLSYYRKLWNWLQSSLESKPKSVQNNIRFNYFLALEKRYPSKDVSYVKKYIYDRFIKWYGKWYSLLRIYLLMLFKYPKIFFLWIKSFICREISRYKSIN